ncbi:hypothetical protein ACEQ8H_001040 [Pleosporales sp. CAS-2024a]
MSPRAHPKDAKVRTTKTRGRTTTRAAPKGKDKEKIELHRNNKRPAKNEGGTRAVKSLKVDHCKTNSSKRVSSASAVQTKAACLEMIDTEASACTPPGPSVIPDSSLSASTSDDKAAILEQEHLREEVDIAYREVDAGKQRCIALQQDMEKTIADVRLEKEEMVMKHAQEIQKLVTELQAEKQRCGDLSRQLADQTMKPTTTLEKEDEVVLQPKAEDMPSRNETQRFIRENSSHQLQAENSAFQDRPVTSQNGLLLSPAPSASSSSIMGGDGKEDNIRKVYTKIKGQHDVLLAVSNNLLHCIPPCDLTSFGDFGRYLARLRQAVERERGPPCSSSAKI